MTRSYACATELFVAVPRVQQDLYALHQRVWDQVKRAQALSHQPTIVYRRDGGLLRVRVSDCAMKQGRPSRVDLSRGKEMRLQVSTAVSRSGKPFSPQYAHARTRELIERSGLSLLDAQLNCRVAVGYKQGMCIELGVADVTAIVRVDDPAVAANAWRHGIGRGKRFGFGMMVFSD